MGETISLEVRADTNEELEALEQALLRARAGELSEVRRHQGRLVAGYGDSTTRQALTGEAGRAELRRTMLDRVLAALRATRPRA